MKQRLRPAGKKRVPRKFIYCFRRFETWKWVARKCGICFNSLTCFEGCRASTRSGNFGYFNGWECKQDEESKYCLQDNRRSLPVSKFCNSSMSFIRNY